MFVRYVNTTSITLHKFATQVLVVVVVMFPGLQNLGTSYVVGEGGGKSQVNLIFGYRNWGHVYTSI